MTSKRSPHTPEQILALQEARKLKKAKPAPPPPVDTDINKGRIIERDWISLRHIEDAKVLQRVKVLTWNLLAQTLVRRSLFPLSDCLKASQREHMIYNEILAQKADIMCLQEVDRLEQLLPTLEDAGYAHHFAAGPGKKHGCLIAFNKTLFTRIDQRCIEYDKQDIRREGDERVRRGSSFRTTNIASLVALRGLGGERGCIVATTHLFWHPKYAYERARQAAILVREVVKFRKDIGHEDWPCIISGDFNFSPEDPAYSLLVGDPILPSQEALLSFSRVLHFTIDPSVPRTSTQIADEEGDPDAGITDARKALPEDGLLTTAELISTISSHAGPLRSAYDEGLREIPGIPIFGDRVTLPAGRRGAHEPQWTSYTHYWKTVLDYIFIIDPVDRESAVVGLLQPHSTENLQPGIPRQGVSGSDHVSLCAELVWQAD